MIDNVVYFADITQSEFVVMLVRLAAYIVPFFLIPAAFKAGMGAFGALTGMLNDRGRGFFDKQRKYRQGRYDYNKARMKAGERFNNRGLNALTSRASTRNLGFGAKGRAAYQQNVNNASVDFSKTAGGQAVQHNDGALQALTYGSKAAALEGLRRGDFGAKKESEIQSAIAAAEASGGFGRNRQVFAAAQLARTGTGYENLEQVAQTIARASNGNASQAAALAGDINASTKQAGRYDLAPGFGKLNGLTEAEMSGGASSAQYHEASVAAARGVDSVSLLRGKPAQVKQLATSLAAHAEANRNLMNSSDPDVANKARDEFIQTMGQIDQLNQSKSYASLENQEVVNKLINETSAAKIDLDSLVGNAPTPLGPQTQQQQDASRYTQVRAPRSYNPDDPRNQT